MTETEGVTFFEIAQAQASQERRHGGRYANEIAAKVEAVPSYTPGASWTRDDVGPEPPLGGPVDPAGDDLEAAKPPEPPMPEAPKLPSDPVLAKLLAEAEPSDPPPTEAT
jgi:hypothetical protein